ncbi:PqiA/YebS family transporter subunit [[Pasteurella] aerogenes]
MKAAQLNLQTSKFHLARCSDCDMLVTVCSLEKNQHAECPRCHNTLHSGSRWGLHRCAMIALSILILMPFALHYPLLSIDLLGAKIDASVWQGIWKMAVQGYPYTAFMIFFCAVFMPISFAVLVILLRLAQLFKVRPRNVLLSLSYIKPWVMFDVYLVALGVTIFKVREYAELSLDIYLIAFIVTALLTTLLFIKLNLNALWYDFYPNKPLLTAAQQQQGQHCTSCNYTFKYAGQDSKGRPICPRCLCTLNTTDQIKLQRTWATLIAGIIMIIPANLLPMSIIYVNGAPSADTLMSGVISFMDMGSYFIAFVVFTASIFVPFSKIIIMLYLLMSIHFHWHHSIKWQMRLLHIVHFVGRWSMLDLFVLALMMSLVSRGQIIDFSVGPAAFYFGATVFLTMISTSQFDSRLLWKIYDRKQ